MLWKIPNRCKRFGFIGFSNRDASFPFFQSSLTSPILKSLPSSKSPSPENSNLSIGISSLWFDKYPFSQFLKSLKILKLDSLRPHIHGFFRFATAQPLNLGDEPSQTSKQVSEIIDLVSRDVSDLGPRLDSIGVSLSKFTIWEIFRTLNNKKVSVLRFFIWIKGSRPDLYSDPHVCNLVIGNCGILEKYEEMHSILASFDLEGVQFTPKFEFLLLLDEASTLSSIRKIVEVLNKVGGFYRTSGIQSLIEMFSGRGTYDIAQFVVAAAGGKAAYFNSLIKELCRKGRLKLALELLNEDRTQGRNPDASTYNFVLSTLCKKGKIGGARQLLDGMKQNGCSPNALTFDILINWACKTGQIDVALQFLDELISNGIEPRLSTHASIIKAYFNSQRYEEARRYVVDSSSQHATSSNANYSLLVHILYQNGNVVLAREILFEMIEKGLTPNFRVYMNIKKHLRRSGLHSLALDLRTKFNSLEGKSDVCIR